MFDKSLLRLDGMRGLLVALICLSFIQAAFVFGQAFALSQAVANLWAGDALEGQWTLLGMFLGCFTARHIVLFAQGELLDRYAARTSGNLQERVLCIVFSDNAQLTKKLGCAATATTATECIDEIARYLTTIPPRLCGIVGISLPLILALFATDVVSGVIALAVLPVIALFMTMLGRQARERARHQFETSRSLANQFIDTLRGIDVVHALGAGERAGAHVHDASEKLRIATMKTLSVAMLSGAVLDLIIVFGVAAIAMMLAFRLMDGSIELATALCALVLAPEAFAPIRSFASEFHASLDGKSSLAAVLSLLDSAHDVPAHTLQDDTIPAWGSATKLELKDVSHRYKGAVEYALRDVSLSLSGMEKVAVVGLSGAGKSTLIDILAGFRAPESGSIIVDGSPHESLCSAAWTRQLHYLPQNPYIFRMSLEDNVRFYAPSATRADIERAVKVVGLDDLVSRLPEGLETVVGDGAQELSGGEAHRVALARTLLDERPILLFDEPTAHLDIETELELKGRMLPLMEGRLVILATHRLHWLSNVDRIVVVEDGRIAEIGTLDELLSGNGALTRFLESERGEAVA